MEDIKISYYKSKAGELILGSYDGKICLCDWRYRKMRDTVDNRIKNGLNAEFILEETPIIRETIKQLDEYFNYKRKTFDIPLLLVGTTFQKQVWESLITIPFGSVVSYLNLAKKIENEKAVRAVANANGANAISIIVPCHRIIGSDGKLVGYAGGLSAKQKLLEIEQDMFVS
ncbi:MAG: methylated-DNA--[protein]-cysteine S-methyltransferase [Spirochaetaceae bacterium]